MKYLKLLPPYYANIKDFRELDRIFNSSISTINTSAQFTLDDMAIMTCSAEKLTQWERSLEIPHGERNDIQRRMVIIATLKGVGKLNEAKIHNIVKTFSNGGCIVTFANSIINIKISPPLWGEIFLFPDAEKALKPLIPAHIGLAVERYYNTWQDRKEQSLNWGTIKTNSPSWSEFKNKVEEL